MAIELDDLQIDEAINAALRLFSRHKPRELRTVITANAGQSKYTVAANTYGRDVTDVQMDYTKSPSSSGVDIFNAEQTRRIYTRMNNLDASDFALDRMDLEQRRTVYGLRFEWEFDAGADPVADAGELNISPSPSATTKLTLLCVADQTIGTVPSRDHDWFIDYVIAESKIMLGLVRRKHGALQGINSTLQLDGESLVQEGKEEKQTLEQQIRENQRQRLVTPLVG